MVQAVQVCEKCVRMDDIEKRLEKGDDSISRIPKMSDDIAELKKIVTEVKAIIDVWNNAKGFANVMKWAAIAAAALTSIGVFLNGCATFIKKM